MMNTCKILVVDDEEDLCEILQFNLENEGYRVDVAYSSEEALRLDYTHYDLFILDIMMGEMSGLKLAKHLKAHSETHSKPIIFLTAKDSENDKLTGFSVGADDYITKPFSIKEVIARVQVSLRRYPQTNGEELNTISHKGLEVNLSQKRVFVDKKEVTLTKKEFDILALLMQKIDYFFSREDLLQKVWKNEVYVLERTVDVNVARLRKKIAPYGEHIMSRVGYGYCFKSE